jgi:hypothetical protein
MPKVQLLGRIFPLALNVTIDQIPKVNYKTLELELDIFVEIHIQKNNVVVACELNKWVKDEHLMPVYMRALDAVRAVVDIASFVSGMGFTVLLETLVEPNGATSSIAPMQPELVALSTSARNDAVPTAADNNNFDKVMRIVLTDFSLARALRDLIDAITDTHVSPLACGRVMEGIRHVIAPNLERKKGWAKMNEILRIDRSYLDLIIDQSKGPRHADPAHVTGEVCREITRRAWIIMNRIFEYKKRGSQPLPESEFPVLR